MTHPATRSQARRTSGAQHSRRECGGRSTTRWRRIWRWAKWTALGLVAVSILAVAIVIGVLHTSWGRSYVKDKIVAELQAEFPGSTIAALEGSPFGTLVLRGVTLNGRDRKPMATIDRIAVQAALRPLLGKTVRADSVRVTGVAVFVREQPPKPAAPDEPTEPSAWTIEAPDIRVDRATVRLETERGIETLDDISLAAGLWIPAGEPVTASATIRASWRGKPASVQAVMSQHGDDTTIPFVVATLGDAHVVGYALEIGDGPTVAGGAVANAPAALVRELADVELPGDVALALDARASGAIAATATVGTARVDAHVVADLRARRATGVVTADAPDFSALTRGQVIGGGTVVIALDASADRVRGIASTVARIDEATLASVRRRAPSRTLPASALVAFDGTLTRVELVAATRAHRIPQRLGGATATVTATLDGSPGGEAWTLTDATLVAQARDIDDVRGTVDAAIAARGPLWPAPDLTATGTIDAAGVRHKTLRVRRAHVDVTARVTRAGTTASTRSSVTGVRSGKLRIPAAALAAELTADADGALAVTLGAHRVRTGDGAVWTGRGGRVAVTPDQIVVTDVRTGTGKSQLTASARVRRDNTNLEATVRARDVAVAMIDPTLRGDVDADVHVTRRGGRWGGNGSLRARGVGALERPPVDATVDFKLTGRRVELAGTAAHPELGSATVAGAVTGPRDITDIAAWQRLPRAALDTVTLTVAGIDARALGGTGRGDGELTITASDASGKLRVRGVETAGGPLDAELAISPAAGGAIRAQLTASVPGIPPASADATLVLPARPFDPASWQALGRDALREATVRATAIAIDPALLARFGFDAPYHARVDATLVAGLGARTATLTADVHGLAGGKLIAPVDVHVAATTDDNGTRGDVTARAANVSIALTAATPLTVEGALAGGARNPRIDATLTIPKVAARDLLALVGREADVLGGRVGGTVTIGGTLARPTARARLAAEQISIASTVTTKKPPVLDKLDVDAQWLGDHAQLVITGHEAGGRLLKISARGRPDDLGSVVAGIEAANFDLTPLAAFAPGALRGARGALTAALTIRGLDPQSGDVRGMLQIKDGRLPLTAELGTLRRATLDVKIVKQTIIARLDGRLGAGGGTVSGDVTAQLVGGMPMAAKLDMKLRKVSPISAVQPVIDADITGNFVNEGPRWAGKLVVSKGNVYIPPETGNELLGSGAPADMIFVDAATLLPRTGRKPPSKPWLTTRIVLGRTNVDVEDKDFRVRVVAKGNLKIDVGDGVGISGTITTERGAVDVIGRRYRLEYGVIDFDGMPDPRLDVRLVHDFKNLALTVDVRGRASDPDLRLSGDPGTYTQGQLLSFLAGAEPGGDDSNTQANQAVVSGGLTILSSRLGRRLNKHLPVKFDTINYEAATASTSRAIRFGLRLSEKSYLLWRQRLEARPDENPGEAVFEYQIRPNALFETTVGERAIGADFLLRTRW